MKGKKLHELIAAGKAKMLTSAPVAVAQVESKGKPEAKKPVEKEKEKEPEPADVDMGGLFGDDE